EQLRAAGLQIIYSSEQLSTSLRVLAEPIASDPRGILQDLIGPHGLDAVDGPSGTLLVVPAPGWEGVASGGVTGRVILDADRRPAAGARVTVAGAPGSVAAAADGRFLIHRLSVGVHALEIRSADGGWQQNVDIRVRNREVTRIVVALAPAPRLVEGVVVTPTRHRIVGEEPETRTTLEGEALERLAHLGEDAHRSASRLPGAATGDKSARFHLRGGDANEVLVVMDGLEIDQPFHIREFLAFSGIIDSRAVEKIDLLAGGFPAEYGGRMSGVMELSSMNPSRSFGASLGTGVPNSWALLQGENAADDRRWLVATRAWYPDMLFDVVDPGGEDINPYYYDGLAKYEFQSAGGTLWSGHLLAARDRVDFEGEETATSARARYETTYVWMNVRTPWTPRLYSLSQLSMGRIASSRDGFSEQAMEGATELADERESSFFGLKQDWTFRANERSLVKWGFDGRRVEADYDFESLSVIDDPLFTAPGSPVVVQRSARLQPSGSRIAAYAAWRTRPVASLTAELGVRWSLQSYTNGRQLDPRVNLVWAPTDRSTFRAAWGLFHQPQRIDEVAVEDGVSRFFPAQRAEHRLLSWEHRFEGGVELRADAYWKTVSRPGPRFENLFNPIELFPDGESDRIRLEPRSATARGIEIFARRDPRTGLAWWASYALARAEDRIGGRSEPRNWDQRHAVAAGIGYRVEPGWRIDVAGTWHSG
ncbi:MAG TPA: TonB-dependent receptor, partial [Candidatus Polarisedimenticolia bacterium]|nr:TonB-dependent receptor [Candidatus Polarisedimenticolia bacterium]